MNDHLSKLPVPEVASAAAGEVLHDGRLEAGVVEGPAVILVVTRVPSRCYAINLKSGHDRFMYRSTHLQ